jgi:adenylate cyclase
MLLFVALTMANLIGAIVVFCFASWALPLPDIADPGTSRLVNLAIFGASLVTGTVIGTVVITRRFSRIRDWLAEDREPTPDERDSLLRAPYRVGVVHALLWSSAALIFGIVNFLAFDQELGERVGITVLLGGVTTTAVAYLLAERVLRPAAARALASGVPDRPVRPGVKGRALLAWSVGTGVPILGLLLVGLSTLTEKDFEPDELAITILALAAIALFAGLYVSIIATRAVADPIVSVRDALARVEQGDLDVEVPVYDGTEVGLLQAGFNRMVAGLRERERLEDLFGRHVGDEVAREALEQGVELGGETREVAILFVDVIGSTALASERRPEQVVELLNSFFKVVVEVVREHGGWVNKFEGDAALAVFGAPVPIEDPATCALAAARELSRRLSQEVELEAGIGVSAGEVVAGNVGEESRFEYTVIGDPVNEAARLTELAKEKPGHVLASQASLERAGDEERGRWELDGEVTLRGRSSETQLAVPADV